MSVAQQCAQASFGEGVLQVDWEGQYDWQRVAPSLKRNHAAVRHWFTMVFNMRSVHPTDGITIAFTIFGRAVCVHTWQAFHGVPERTMKLMCSLVKQGVTTWNDDVAKEASLARRNEKAYLLTAASQWWCLRLDYYECIVESGKIQYPAGMDWRLVYDTEFVPEMRLHGYDWRVSSKDSGSCGSTSTWYEGRKHALQQLATERIGPQAKPFSFVSRAKHSAYVPAMLCDLTA